MQHSPRVQELSQQQLVYYERVSAIDHNYPLIRKDLERMLGVATSTWTELDKELVICRRLGRYTAAYQSLEDRLEDQVKSTGKWLTLALLKIS